MLTHYYNQEQSQSSQLSQKILRLKSIKQDLNQDESYGYNLLAPTLTLTLRMKGMVLMGLLAKNKGTATKVLKKAILIWYTHSNHNRHVHAINKFVTGGNVRKQQIFYRLKIMANIQILYQGVITTKEKRQKGSKKGQKKRSQNQKKVLISADNSYLKNNKPLLDLQKKNGQINENYMVSLNVCDKQKNQQCKKSNKGNHFFASNNISINNILLESQTILKGNQGINNQNSRQFSQNKSKSNLDNQSNQSKSKQSISLIDPISGNLPMQLNTCANLFQNSSSRRNRATFRISGIIQLCRQTDKIKNKLLRHAFKKLIQNSMEQDYENQLLQVRRHLELVQENFMVQCQIEAILQNYEQQNQHLDKIDNHIQTLKQKFLFSTTASIVKALKKLIYPNLQVFYSQFQENNKSEKNYIIKAKSIKLYQVHELFDASSNSLSYKTYSNNLLKNAQNESNKEPSYTGFIANNSLKLCTESFPENDNYDNSHMGNEKE